MNEGARLFWAVLTAAVLTWFTHWLSGTVGYPLHVGWCALIGGGVAVLVWYWRHLRALFQAIGDAAADWW